METKESYETIVQLLGNNIHSLQDFYSHTNWIEMGKTDININVGLNADLGVPILSPNETSCSTCSIKDMSPAERKIYDDFVENPISQILFGFIPCLKGSTEYAFPCQNNVATNGLTSGYYESEKDIAPKPPSGNKCSHGGGFDESVTIAATGGISKDADNMFFAPHYKLHKKAAKLAVEATIQYFEDFRLSIDDEIKFGQLIGIQYTPSIGIAIVLDTTESMKTQWNDVITQVLDDIDEVTKKNPSKTINYFLMPFNDPDFGFPSEDKGVFATNNLTEFSQKLNSLKPMGGGDIPEMCLPAILSTLKKVGTGVSINIYTDSISKKPEFLQQIGSIAVGKNVKLSFTMFGENLPNSINHKKSLSAILGLRHSHEIFQNYQKVNVDEDDSNANETEAYSTLQDYINLATLTEGFYEKYRKIYGAKQRFSATNNISRNDWEIIDSVLIVDSATFSYSFIVDDTMNYIEIELVSIFGGETIKNLNVNISSPTTLLPLNENFTTDMVRKFVYNNPTPGNWTMDIDKIDVTQQILLKVSSPSYLDVHVRLIPSLNSSTQHLRAPIIGEGKYDIFIECASCKTMESLIVTPCGNETRYHQSAPVFVTSFNWWYIENVIFPEAGGLVWGL
uniref:Uncharacterized protein n=1 Tax=Panagrolaimus davidi TaxID=227884 RepID=A0A914P1Q1_9BILA